jgi:hypothetical protein
MEENEISADLDRTVAFLQGGGVEGIGIEAALPVIEGWQQRLEASGSPELLAVAENLAALKTQLSASDPDPAAVGELLVTLAEQVQVVANGDVEPLISDRLSQLSVMLEAEGSSLSGEGAV